jgi:hypothetical protein
MIATKNKLTGPALTAAAFGYFAAFANAALENARFGPRHARAAEIHNARRYGAMARREFARLQAAN